MYSLNLGLHLWRSVEGEPMVGRYVPSGYTLELGLASVGKGWSGLVKRLFEEKDKYPEILVTQVKEKFGLLRVYYDHDLVRYHEELNSELYKDHYKLFHSLVYKLEEESRNICEECGNRASLVEIKNWFHTLCDSCTDRLRHEQN